MTDSDREFLGNEYHCGFCAGAFGQTLDDILGKLECELDRPLNDRERGLVSEGHADGARERAQWLEDARRGADKPAPKPIPADEIPL